MKLEDYKAWLLEHGEIKEEYERPYNPQCDPPEYENGSYFLSYDLMYAGRPYAGLSGGFGGANYQKTEDYSSMDEALKDAYALAVEEYQSYEVCHGIMSWDDCREDLIDSGFDYDDEAVDDRYQEELESWLSYYVEPEEE